MQKLILVSLFILATFSALSAQSSERETQGSRWWYGAHVNLGFSASQNLSVLSLGLSPMAGYKVTPDLSVGPRLIANFTNFRIRDFAGTVDGVGVFDYGVGGFVRANVYRGFFAQGEFGYENRGQVQSNGSQFIESRFDGLNAYIGAGYNSATGGNLAYEVMLAYDLNLIGENTLDLLNYRVGFTIFY